MHMRVNQSRADIFPLEINPRSIGIFKDEFVGRADRGEHPTIDEECLKPWEKLTRAGIDYSTVGQVDLRRWTCEPWLDPELCQPEVETRRPRQPNVIQWSV